MCVFVSALPAIPAQAEENGEQSGIITEEFENFDNMKSHSGAMSPVTLEGASYDGDTTGLAMAGAAKDSEIVYETPFEIGSYTLWLKGDTGEYTPDFKIYLSKDGKNYEWDNYAEHRNAGSLRIYTNPEVFNEHRFLKIVYNGTQAPKNLYLLKLEIREEGFVSFDGTRIYRSEPSTYDYSKLPSLKEAYKDYFKIGAALEYRDIEREPELLASQFNVIGSEGQTHITGLQQSEGNFTWYWADRIYDWGNDRGMMGRLHALFYYVNTPEWIKLQPGGGKVSKELFLKRYERHIKTVVSHYKGKIEYYDVVNELIDAGQYRPYMFQYQMFEEESEFEDFIASLFLWAYEADPDAKLIFLDGGLLAKQKRNRHWFELFGERILPRILEKGVPKENLIIGEQGHWGINDYVTKEQSGGSGDSLEELLDDVRKLGLHVAFTEMDMGVTADMYISDQTGQKTDLGREELQEIAAKKWGLIFDVLRDNSDIVDFVTFWGPTDNTNVRTQTTGTCGTFFDYNFEPYPAFWRVLDFEKKLPRWTTDDITEINYGDGWTRRESQAVYGTPVIDGKIDDIWKKTEKIELNRQTVGKADEGATGTLRMMWDEEHLYALFEVADTDINVDNEYTWFQDCIELFISENDARAGAYVMGDSQYRVVANGVTAGKGYADWSKDWYNTVAVSDKNGYTVEIAYDMHSKTNADGDVIGLEAQVIDHADKYGTRRSVRKYCDTLKNTSENTTCWGTCRLVTKLGAVGGNSGNAAIGGDFGAENADVKRFTVKMGDEELSMGAFTDGGADYALLRSTAASLGGTVRYSRADETIKLNANGRTVVLKNGSDAAYVNGNKIMLGAAVRIGENGTLVPLGGVLTALGLDFETE